MTITRLESDRFTAFEKIDFKPCGADPWLRLGPRRGMNRAIFKCVCRHAG